MFNLFNLKIGSFGLDISDLSLKIIQLKKRNGKPNIVAIGYSALPEGIVKKGVVKDIDSLSQEIKKLISKTKKLDTKQVIVSLPEEKSFLKVIKMPKLPIAEVKKAARYEAENYIPFSLDKVYLDSEVLEDSGSDKIEVLIVAMTKKVIDPYVTAIKKAGLKLKALETESASAARALIKRGESKNPVYFIDLGASSTSFSVFYGHSLRFASYVPISCNGFTKIIAKKLNKTIEEAEALQKIYGFKNKNKIEKQIFEILKPKTEELVKEIKKNIDYYESHAKDNNLSDNKKKIKQIFFHGGGAEISGLSEYLSENLRKEVIKGSPLINLSEKSADFFESQKRKPLSYVVAVGLALRDFNL